MQDFKVGKLFGVDIYLNFWLLIFLGCVFIFQGIGNFLLFSLAFLCVLLHEFGHIFAAKHYNISCKKVLLTPIGGLAMLNYVESAKNYKPFRDFVIAVCGPLVNLGLCIIAIIGEVIYKSSTGQNFANTHDFFYYLFFLNALLLIFNLIPAYPMDGGRIYKSILSIFFDYQKSGRIAGLTGMILGTLMAGFFLFKLALMGMLIGCFITFLAYVEYQSNKVHVK